MNAAAKRVNTMHAFIWADKDGVYSWYFEYTGDYKRLQEQSIIGGQFVTDRRYGCCLKKKTISFNK